MKTTTPAQAPTTPAPSYTRQLDARQRRHGFSPLVRAALDNGLPFADVEAYATRAPERAPVCDGPVCDGPGTLDAELTDAALDAALARSVLAAGSIEHARLWWRGVL